MFSIHTGRTARSPKGVYDRDILCASCDNALGKYDCYAAKILRPLPKRGNLYRSDDRFIAKGSRTRHLGYWIRKPDVSLLQVFAASLIWRAGVTSRPEMSVHVSDEVLARARRVIEGDHDSRFTVMAMRCIDRHLSEFVARPTLLNNDFAPGVQFYMNGVVLNVFERPPKLHQQILALLLGSGEDWLIGFVPFWGSKFEETMREIVQRENEDERISEGRDSVEVGARRRSSRVAPEKRAADRCHDAESVKQTNSGEMLHKDRDR